MNSFSIKRKLSLIILIISVPMLCIQAYFIYNQFKNVIEFELNADQDFAEAVGRIFYNHIQSIEKNLNLIGTTIVNSQMSPEEISLYLKEQKALHPEVMHYVWNIGGIVIASSFDGAIGANVQDQEFYHSIIAGKDLVVSDVIVTDSHLPFITIDRAIRQGTELMGIFTASINIDFLDKIMPEHRVGISSSFGIADRNGTIVYQNSFSGIIHHTKRIPELAISILESSNIVRDEKYTSSFSNIDTLGVAVPISGVGWAAYAYSEYQSVINKAIDSVKFNILVLIITIIISLMLALILSEKILEQIQKMQCFAMQICEGNMDVRTNLTGNDELATTGQALDDMASKIIELEDTRRLFIQASAHELRNPMAGIKGIVAIIKRRLKSGKPVDDVLHMLDTAENEIDRLSAILNQILDAFKEQNIHSYRLAYNWEKIDLTKLIIEVTQAFQMGNEKFTIALNLDSNKHVFIDGDTARLEDVLRNLLSNAVKYSQGDSKITVSLQVMDDSAIVSVKDSGVGIPDNQLELIFESFVRGQNLDGNDPGGIGLGLYICRDIIEKHGGTIWADNNNDKGSTFFLKFPVFKEHDP